MQLIKIKPNVSWWELVGREKSIPQSELDFKKLFKMVISEDPWHSHLLPTVWQRAVTTCFVVAEIHWYFDRL